MPKYRNMERTIRVLVNPDANGYFPQRVSYNRRGGLRSKIREGISDVYKCTM